MCTFDWLIWMANKGNEGKEKADSCGPSSSRNAARPWHKPKFHQVEEMCGFLVLDGLTTFDGEENVFFTIPSLYFLYFSFKFSQRMLSEGSSNSTVWGLLAAHLNKPL